MTLPERDVALEMTPAEFREVGHKTVDRLADFLESLPDRPVTPHESVKEVRALLTEDRVPEEGSSPAALLDEAASLLFEHSLFNGHPGFLGYITSSSAPIGALGDLLAGVVNPNVGGWNLAPIASEIEVQTVRWVAELIGYPPSCGGLLVSGGNMANFIGFLTARTVKAPEARTAGLGAAGKLRAYVSEETHTWIDKAGDHYGIGSDAVCRIPTDDEYRMDAAALRAQVESDLDAGMRPFLVVGTAGTTSTGAIDPLSELADVCDEHDLWFHVDGAYGALAAMLPDADPELGAMGRAHSLAIDPHKWLYTPVEAGCVLVADPEALRSTFSYTPAYYHFEAEDPLQPTNFYEFGPQNSRGFRALKVWLALRQAGRAGYRQMIGDDVALARSIYDRGKAHPDLEAFTHSLSIATFRFRPHDLDGEGAEIESYLDGLNEKILSRVQKGGRYFPSHTILRGKFVLRPCVVNFRTTAREVEGLVHEVAAIGRELDATSRPATFS